MWVVALVGLLSVVIAVANPWSLADRGFERGERLKIGKLRLGINLYARTPEMYRIFLGLIGTIIVVIAGVYLLNQ